MDTFFLTFTCNTGPDVLYDGLRNFYDIRLINIKYIGNKQKSSFLKKNVINFSPYVPYFYVNLTVRRERLLPSLCPPVHCHKTLLFTKEY